MKRWLCLLTLLTASMAPLSAQTVDPPIDIDRLKEKPIAVGGGKVGELLRQWWKEGTASGNAGDVYDNRDGDHSPLNLTPWPQMSAIKYSKDDIKLFKHWAAQRVIVPHVTFGNSSTSAPAHLGGSNPRSYYVSARGLAFLYEEYTRNNLYIYPEHRDHDPGHNGRGDGYGDMYPTNTPYLIISQGSSGSDQPFMRMMPYVLAAFRPEVKKKLTETGTLMPTIQMLFRSTNKHLKDPKEYLTGKAHPTVFEGSWVDDLAIVQKAHALELNALPPMVQLRVVEEDKAINGLDYHDLVSTEVLADTPACIARIHRSKAYKRRIVVSAEPSFDVNKSKLTYTWVILRGDPDKIKIVPKKDDQSVAEITVAWHDRRPVSPGSPLESNRVDIGVFVHNGTHYSAPGFVTFHTLDREARTYNKDGKLLEIAHGMGETEIRVTDWAKLLSHLQATPMDAQIMPIDSEQKAAFGVLAAKHAQRSAELALVQASVKRAEVLFKNMPTEPGLKEKLEKERKRVTEIQKAMKDLVEKKSDELGEAPQQFVVSRLTKLVQDPLFTLNQKDWLNKRRTAAVEPRIKSLWQKPMRLGIANEKEVLLPLLPGMTLAEAKWTPFERAQLEHLHASLLAELAFSGMVQVLWQANYVDHRLSAPREWRDVDRFDSKGQYIGWYRYSAAGVQDFNYEGLLVVEKDLQWRCLKGRIVSYVQDAPKAKGINTNLLRAVTGDTIVRYEYDGPKDMRGRRAGMEPAKDNDK